MMAAYGPLLLSVIFTVTPKITSHRLPHLSSPIRTSAPFLLTILYLCILLGWKDPSLLNGDSKTRLHPTTRTIVSLGTLPGWSWSFLRYKEYNAAKFDVAGNALDAKRKVVNTVAATIAIRSCRGTPLATSESTSSQNLSSTNAESNTSFSVIEYIFGGPMPIEPG